MQLSHVRRIVCTSALGVARHDYLTAAHEVEAALQGLLPPLPPCRRHILVADRQLVPGRNVTPSTQSLQKAESTEFAWFEQTHVRSTAIASS
jgi:hypothetical protein